MLKSTNTNINNQSFSPVEYLSNVKNNHKIWNNPLLQACENGSLVKRDFQFLFSQYYLYSKNFTKLLTVAMLKCDDDYYRSKLSENLWEEGGGQDIELRHAEIYRNFLKNHLNIPLEQIKFEPYTELFYKNYLELCLNSKPYECAAVLSFGTEGIVSRLYSIIKKGLLKVGLTENDLTFFNIHIECDDDHALTLEQMALSYNNESQWLENCEKITIEALDLRDAFFTHIYNSIQDHSFKALKERISKNSFGVIDKKEFDSKNFSNNIQSIQKTKNKLYVNKNDQENINFTVDRVPFSADVLDPRVVRIAPGYCNELHSHAHETIFIILKGKGEVIIDSSMSPVNEGDIVFIPRWVKHQTRNTDNQELMFFAITDYGLTGLIPQNTESVYRQKKDYAA